MKIIILIAALAQIAAAQPRLFGGGNATSLRGKPMNSSVSSPTNGCYIQWDTGLTPPAYKCAAGGGGGSLSIEDNGGSVIGAATTLRLATGTGMSWVITDLGIGVIRATPNVDTTGLATLTGVQTLTNKTLGSGTTFTHASQHQNGGSDEVATATPGANAIPKADSGGKLASGWLPSNATMGFLLAGNAGSATIPANTSSAATNNYFSVAGSLTVAVSREVISTSACTLRNLRIRTGSSQPANGSASVTVYVNGSASSIVATIPAGSASGEFVDLSNAVAISAGDRIVFQGTNSSADSASASIRGHSIQCN